MPAAADTLESVETRARALLAPAVVVEVRAATNGYDATLGRPRAVLAVSVILAAPGDEDSRYRIEHLARVDADDPAAAHAALATARRLAEHLGVPLHPPSSDPPSDAPGWLSLQGPSPERPWPMTWRTTVWRPDGTTADAEHQRTVIAASGRQAFHRAFLIDLVDLAAAGAFCRGELSDDALDASLGPAVAARRPTWSLPHALRRAHTQGESIGPVLHRHYHDVGGTIPLVIGLRDAFDLSLMAAKALVDTACDGHHDDELIVMVRLAVAAIAAGDRDDYRAMYAEPLDGRGPSS